MYMTNVAIILRGPDTFKDFVFMSQVDSNVTRIDIQTSVSSTDLQMTGTYSTSIGNTVQSSYQNTDHFRLRPYITDLPRSYPPDTFHRTVSYPTCGLCSISQTVISPQPPPHLLTLRGSQSNCRLGFMASRDHRKKKGA